LPWNRFCLHWDGKEFPKRTERIPTWTELHMNGLATTRLMPFFSDMGGPWRLWRTRIGQAVPALT